MQKRSHTRTTKQYSSKELLVIDNIIKLCNALQLVNYSISEGIPRAVVPRSFKSLLFRVLN